jgi:hypothetical protein
MEAQETVRELRALIEKSHEEWGFRLRAGRSKDGTRLLLEERVRRLEVADVDDNEPQQGAQRCAVEAFNGLNDWCTSAR